MSARTIVVSALLSLFALVTGCASGGANSAPALPVASSIASDARIDAMLERSCYDCHSNQPPAWNARLAPSHWFTGSAREDLNFSEWPSYDANRRAAEARAIANTVRKGSMPPGDYTFFRPSAKLNGDEKDLLTQWASKQGAMAAH